MCGCASHQGQAASAGHVGEDASFAFRVEDMTCGHCAGTIKKAIETGLPGAQVEADPRTKLVSVRGTSDVTAVHDLVSAAGYTPSVMPVMA
jgi:copper chaperone